MKKTKVVLEVDGQSIPLNAFVQKFLAGTVTGMIGTLDRVGEKFREARLIIKKEVKKR